MGGTEVAGDGVSDIKEFVDSSTGLAMRACVSERRWLGFSYVLYLRM